MKSQKAQTGIALVILGVIAIIAVIGLVLLFTNASAQGAAIGVSYGDDRGIATTYPAPTIGGPAVAYPAYSASSVTKTARTPAFIVSAKFAGVNTGYADLQQVYGCEWSIMTGSKVGVPHDQFNCYSVPNVQGSGDATGMYPRSSSAEPRVPKYESPYMGKLGGDMYCYANSNGAEGQVSNAEDLVRMNLVNIVNSGKGNSEGYTWTTTTMNGKTVPVCWVSSEAFPFPQ